MYKLAIEYYQTETFGIIDGSEKDGKKCSACEYWITGRKARKGLERNEGRDRDGEAATVKTVCSCGMLD